MAPKMAQAPLVCHGHTRPIVDLQFSPVTPDGYFLTSASKDGQPQLRAGATGDWIGTFVGHKGAVWACVLNDAATLAATASADFSARVWSALTGDELHHFPHRHIVRLAAFERGADARRLATGGPERLLRLFDLGRPDAAPAALGPAPDAPRCAAWASDNALLLVSYSDRAGVDVWDVRAGGVARTLATPAGVTSLELVALDGGRGRRLVGVDSSGVHFWDGDSLAHLKSVAVEGYVPESAALAPDGGRFVAGGSDMWTHVYDYGSGAELEAGRGHHGPVHCVRFAPGGRAYASGSEDGTIRIWNL